MISNEQQLHEQLIALLPPKPAICDCGTLPHPEGVVGCIHEPGAAELGQVPGVDVHFDDEPKRAASLLGDIGQIKHAGKGLVIVLDALDGVDFAIMSPADAHDLASAITVETLTPDCDPPAPNTIAGVWVVEPDKITQYVGSEQK